MARISPWDGFPSTRETTDRNGKRCFIVKPRVLTPQRARIAEFCSRGVAAALMVGGFIYFSKYLPDAELWVWIVVTFFPWIFRSVFRDLIGGLISKKTKIVLTESTFEIHGLVGRRVFDRTLDHSLSLFNHDLAEAEMRSHEFEVRKAATRGKTIRKTPYFADSAVVSFDYLGQRNDVLSVYPKVTAHVVLTRLQACDATLNRQIGSGDGFATGPSDQWRAQPGDLPDDE